MGPLLVSSGDPVDASNRIVASLASMGPLLVSSGDTIGSTDTRARDD